MSRRMFRGYSKEIHKWIYGCYVCDEEGCWERGVEGKSFIVSKNNGIWYEVEKDSVGQCVGINDMNGVEIYEGDIVTGEDYPFIDEGKQNYVGIVEYYEDVAGFGYTYQCVRKDKKGISNGISNQFETNEDLVCKDLKVIGNTYINPWLLEVDANDE